MAIDKQQRLKFARDVLTGKTPEDPFLLIADEGHISNLTDREVIETCERVIDTTSKKILDES